MIMRLRFFLSLIGLTAFTLSVFADEHTDSVPSDPLEIQFTNPDTCCAGVFSPAREYVGAQNPHPMFEIGYRNKISYLGLYLEQSDNLHLHTDLQKLISANIYWKWVRLGYSFALSNYNRGFNFDYSFTFGAFNLSAGVAHVRNFKLINKSDYEGIPSEGEDVRLNNFRSSDWNINVEYMLNKKKFSGLSAYDYSYHKAQLKSHGSPIVGLSYAYNSFLKRDYDNNSDAGAVLNELAVDRGYIYTGNVGLGYGHNISFHHGKYVLGMFCLPYLAVGYADVMTDGQDSRTFDKDFGCGVRAHARVNFTYSYVYGAFSVSGEYNGAYLPFDQFDYRRDIVVLRINHAFKLGSYGLKSCKMPLHKFMDNTQRFWNKL